MTVDVVFNIAEFRDQYPSVKATDAQLELAYEQATILLNNNKDRGIRIPTEKRKVLLYLLIAHFAILLERIGKGNQSVGRVTGATEGSVSVSFDAGPASMGKAFYQQTQFGQMFLALTSIYRSFLYVAGSMPMPVRRTPLSYRRY